MSELQYNNRGGWVLALISTTAILASRDVKHFLITLLDLDSIKMRDSGFSCYTIVRVTDLSQYRSVSELGEHTLDVVCDPLDAV